MNSSKVLVPRLHPSRAVRHPPFITGVGVCVVGGFVLLLPLHGADGDLDLTFVADSAYPVDALALGVMEGEFYFSYPSLPSRRLRLDVSLDGDWSLDLPSGEMFITELRRTPSGGWVFKGPSSAYLDDGSGEAQRIGWLLSGDTLFPQDDGSVVFGNPLSRFSPDGVNDPRFGSDARFVAASFSDGAGTSRTGGPSTITIQDDFNRFIVAGNLQQAGDWQRLGLARILPNGQVDPDWDVASSLGIELNLEGYLSALPITNPGSEPTNSFISRRGLEVYRNQSCNGIWTGWSYLDKLIQACGCWWIARSRLETTR